MMNFNAPDANYVPPEPMSIGKLLEEIAAAKAAGVLDDTTKVMLHGMGSPVALQSVIVYTDNVVAFSRKTEQEIQDAGEGQQYQAPPEQDEVAQQKIQRTVQASFLKHMRPSPELAKIVGNEPLPRTEMTKRIWEYIKQHGLQNAQNKRMIDADATLKAIFGGRDQVSMFEMTKLVNDHLK